MIGDIAAVDPSEYERQQNSTGEKAGVRSIAAFVEEMALRVPRLMANQISLLLPHLGGKAWTLRSGIVVALGYLLHKAFDASAGDAADAAGTVARLRSKQHLLDILCERVRDQSSFTRKAVLQTWSYLAENRAVPLGHWQVVTAVAVGRLEDKSSLVRKEALRLLGALMLHNPFGPALPVDRFGASLTVHKAMLDAVMPPESENNDAMTVAVEINEEEEKDDDNAEGGEMGKDDAMEVEGTEENVDENEGEKAEEENEEEIQHRQQQQQQQTARSLAEVGWDGTIEELQALVASLELAVDFSRSLAGCMPTLIQLLASSSVSDVQESIALLLTCKQFEVAGAPEAIRKMLPLVFARDEAVKDRIVQALDQLYITGWAGHSFTSAQAARNLVDLASGANLGELGSMEEVVKELLAKAFLTPVALHELWEIAGRAGAAVAAGSQGSDRARKDLRASLAVLSMAAACTPAAFKEQHIAAFLKLGFAQDGQPHVADALTIRHACLALQRLEGNLKSGTGPEYDALRVQMYAAFTRTVVASPLPEASWYSAAEAALTALYVLHPAPEHICGAIVRHIASGVFTPTSTTTTEAMDNAEDEEIFSSSAVVDNVSLSSSSTVVSAAALSRLFFVLGHVALQHMVLIERTAKAVRRARMEAEKRVAEDKVERQQAKRSGKSSSTEKEKEDENEDINAELGVGSVAADAELDAMKEACETQILAAQSLLGPYARLVSAICRHRSLLNGDATLRSSALLALSKMMVVDPRMCEENVQLMFTLLAARSVEPALRSNLTIALGDLALRFPNLMEPWTEHMYRPLGDPDISVRKNALMVLSHLILNDMMKVKGHIAKMAVCLEDNDDRISALAQLFFHELAKKEYKGTSPIYNLLPDILSSLSKETGLTRAGFQAVMQRLLGYIKKDKQGDALVEKLCQRFASSEDPTQWRNMAFCLSQLPISEKGVRKFADCFKLYKTALGDGETADILGGVLAKMKKSASKPEVKAAVEELEAKIEAAAAERMEEEAAATAAAQRAAQDRAAAAASGVEESEVLVDDDDVDMMEEEEENEEESAEKVLEEVEASPPPPSVTQMNIEEEPEEEIDESQEQKEEEEIKPVRRTRGREVSTGDSETVVATAAPKRATRGTRKSATEEENENVAENIATARSGRSTRGGSSKTSKSDVAVVAPAKGRRRAIVVDSDDGDEEEVEEDMRIAAVQAGMAAMMVKEENV